MKLMQNSGVPIYQQIADSFKTDILAGRYEQGEFLPSIRGLAKDLKISVITTMKAYEQLADEGLITAAEGVAAFSARRVILTVYVLTVPSCAVTFTPRVFSPTARLTLPK